MDANTQLTIEVTKYWSPISWAHWNEQNAMPADMPESIWERHQRHNAAMQCSALGVHRFYCYDCRYMWKNPNRNEPIPTY